MGTGFANAVNAMRIYRAELHVHTVLSPCAQVESIPPLIVRSAVERGIDIIAISDHNAMDNIASVTAAAAGTNLTVLPGVELQTREEVHMLCLFDDLNTALRFQSAIDDTLPGLANDPQYFGEQYVVDETGDFVREDPRLLLASTTFSLEEAAEAVHALGGLAIPAHIDRKAFGLIPSLGFIPPDLCVDALEISRRLLPEEAIRQYPMIGAYPLLLGGDAHHPDDLLGANLFQLNAPTLNEIHLALQGQEGRSMTIEVDKLHPM